MEVDSIAMIKLNDMAKRLCVTVRTLQEWDCNGKFTAHRSPTNRRYYTEEQYQKSLWRMHGYQRADKRMI